ncbi:hypothetical protein ACWDV7_17315 [Streptomyces sp. NPDC003362]
MTDRRDTFAEHLARAATGVLERFPAGLRPEIYALSFRIWRVDGDERRPYVAIGYNTETQYAAERRPEDPGEARWNYACWLLDGFETLGSVPEDPVGSALHQEEARAAGLWFEDPDEEGDGGGGFDDDDDEIDVKSDLLRSHFYDTCVGLARTLHAEGHIERILGRPLPVVVFDMDCPGWEVEATEAANPPGLIREFLAWQRAQVVT